MSLMDWTRASAGLLFSSEFEVIQDGRGNAQGSSVDMTPGSDDRSSPPLPAVEVPS